MGDKIEIFQIKYNLTEAQKVVNEMLTKEGLETLSSPEEIKDRKRTETIQKQKGEEKKKKDEKNKGHSK